MAEALVTLQNVFTLAFIVSSMLAMGLSLTVAQIARPLRSPRLVIVALAANFVIAPLTAVVLSKVIPMDPQLQIGLILMGSAAGAPFLPKLATIAKADVAFAVGLMAMLIVVTVVFLPIFLPLVLSGVTVDALSIAMSLFLQMLVPLIAGLFVKQRWPESAAGLVPSLAQVSNISLVLLLTLMLATNIENVIALFGSGALLATAILLGVCVIAGFLLGGPGSDKRAVLALGTGQRNLAASFSVAAGSFAAQPNVLVFLAGAGLIGMVIMFPIAAELGRRSGQPDAVAAP